MLELLREFGLEQLAASGEENMIRRRHAGFFLVLAEKSKAQRKSGEQVHWMERMEQDHDNLRAALEWSRTADGAGDLCLRLASALGYFWEMRGYFREGRERLSAVLGMEFAQARTAERADLLARAAELAYRQSDYAATVELAEESLGICREVGDKQGVASMLIKLGNAAIEAGDDAAAVAYLEEALAIWRELTDPYGIARALISLAWAALKTGEYPLARLRLEEALALSRELKDTRSMGFELSGLGEIALGWVAIHEKDWERAIAWLGESLQVRQEIGDRGGSAWCLERLAEVAQAQGELEKAARLLSAAAMLRISIGSVIDPVDQADYQNRRKALQTELGQQRFRQLWDEGRLLTLEQAVAYAGED
jgi:tetratricopeptide (TPR) repeat protein